MHGARRLLVARAAAALRVGARARAPSFGHERRRADGVRGGRTAAARESRCAAEGQKLKTEKAPPLSTPRHTWTCSTRSRRGTCSTSAPPRRPPSCRGRAPADRVGHHAEALPELVHEAERELLVAHGGADEEDAGHLGRLVVVGEQRRAGEAALRLVGLVRQVKGGRRPRRRPRSRCRGRADERCGQPARHLRRTRVPAANGFRSGPFSAGVSAAFPTAMTLNLLSSPSPPSSRGAAPSASEASMRRPPRAAAPVYGASSVDRSAIWTFTSPSTRAACTSCPPLRG